jgi:hypothetical protein
MGHVPPHGGFKVQALGLRLASLSGIPLSYSNQEVQYLMKFRKL